MGFFKGNSRSKFESVAYTVLLLAFFFAVGLAGGVLYRLMPSTTTNGSVDKPQATPEAKATPPAAPVLAEASSAVTPPPASRQPAAKPAPTAVATKAPGPAPTPPAAKAAVMPPAPAAPAPAPQTAATTPADPIAPATPADAPAPALPAATDETPSLAALSNTSAAVALPSPTVNSASTTADDPPAPADKAPDKKAASAKPAAPPAKQAAKTPAKETAAKTKDAAVSKTKVAALAASLSPKHAPSEAAAAPAKSAKDASGYRVQFGVFSIEDNAHRVQWAVEATGLPVEVAHLLSAKGHMLYYVRSQPYADRATATAAGATARDKAKGFVNAEPIEFVIVSDASAPAQQVSAASR